MNEIKNTNEIVEAVKELIEKYASRSIKTYNKDFYLWGANVKGYHLNVCYYQNLNKLFIHLGDKKVWFTEKAQANYKTILVEVEMNIEHLKPNGRRVIA